ncbi:MAG: hypothetical protein ABI586_09390 [Candidatus Nanopelagicales bacterium]
MNRMIMGMATAAAFAAAGIGTMGSNAAAAGSGDPCPMTLPQGSDSVTLDPADFVSHIDNEYSPMPQGARWVYRESDIEGNASHVVVKVLDRTKPILGIDATVVHDTLSHNGHIVENTFDWYGQDVCGDVWYLGENTREFKNGQVVSREGSWEAGVAGALAGVVMAADPSVGLTYRQEYKAGEAEDSAAVLSLDEQAKVPAGHFTKLVLTKEFTPVEPRVLEYKFYAKGVGLVLAIGISGGSDREELIRYHVPTT